MALMEEGSERQKRGGWEKVEAESKRNSRGGRGQV